MPIGMSTPQAKDIREPARMMSNIKVSRAFEFYSLEMFWLKFCDNGRIPILLV